MKKLIATVTQAGKRWLGQWLRQLADLFLQQPGRFLSHILNHLNQLLDRLPDKLSTRLLRRQGSGLVAGFIALSLVGCANQAQSVRLLELPDLPSIGGEVRQLSGGKNDGILEVAPPAIFVDLAELMVNSEPQVAIALPKPDQIIDTTTLTAKINLRGLSIYKDEATALGPHLQIILDNQPAQSIYSLDDPLEFLDLAPGSHTLRVLAVKPWGESFKGDAAYAQTTFHVFTKTGENTPSPDQPLLTYNEPQGSYGAEPILLDFYLSNAPLHLIAQDDPTLPDWKIRCDVNGQRFVFDQWQPMYLKGLKPGQNWIQTTLIDEEGNPIENAFNSTVRIVNYNPDERTTLAKMTRGELSLKAVGQIADPSYEPPLEPEIAPDAESEIKALPETDPGASLPPKETPKETPENSSDETPLVEPKDEPTFDEVSPSMNTEENRETPADRNGGNGTVVPEQEQTESLEPIVPNPEIVPPKEVPSATLKSPDDKKSSKFFSPFKDFDEFNQGSSDVLSTEQQFVDEPVDELIDEPIDELIDEPIDKPTGEPVDEPINKAADELGDDRDLDELETPLPKTLKAPQNLKEVIISP